MSCKMKNRSTYKQTEQVCKEYFMHKLPRTPPQKIIFGHACKYTVYQHTEFQTKIPIIEKSSCTELRFTIEDLKIRRVTVLFLFIYRPQNLFFTAIYK